MMVMMMKKVVMKVEVEEMIKMVEEKVVVVNLEKKMEARTLLNLQ